MLYTIIEIPLPFSFYLSYIFPHSLFLLIINKKKVEKGLFRKEVNKIKIRTEIEILRNDSVTISSLDFQRLYNTQVHL